MPEKEAHQLEAGAEMDFRALELEIDREIDSLFVPTVQRVNIEAEANDFPKQDSASEKNESGGDPGNSLDFDVLQVEIDKEIDSLFVPSANLDGSEDRVRTGKPEQPKPFFEPTLQAKHDDAPPDGGFDSKKYYSRELSRLIEIFNAAYLSLDWEFSRENLQKFIAALHQLEPFASRSSDARSVFRIIDVILIRLLDRPHAINSKLIQLIRDSQGLLAHILLVEGETGPNEKRRLKDLIDQFHDLRQRALAVKAEAKRSKTREVPPKTTPPIYYDKSRPPSQDGAVPILSTSNKSPARDKVDPLPDAKGERRAQWPGGAEPVAEPAASEKTDPAYPALPVRREDAYLITQCGKCLALPASGVVRIAPSPDRKGSKILKRGYATLTDFTRPFRRVKSAVLSEWKRLPSRELKSYRFEPLGFGSSGQAVTSGPMAVLSSDGQTHRIIFCETVNLITDAEIAAGPSSQGTLSFEIKSHLLAPLFDLRGPFSAPDEAEASAEDSFNPVDRGQGQTSTTD